MMEDKNTKDTYIKDSNVEIIVTNGESSLTNKNSKKTDYLSFGIILFVMFAVVAYVMISKFLGHKIIF